MALPKHSFDMYASYHPATGQIVPEPLMAIIMDHDIRGDGQIMAVMALTHEFIHFWLHKNFGYLAMVQYDNIAYDHEKGLDIRLYNILQRQFGELEDAHERKVKGLSLLTGPPSLDGCKSHIGQSPVSKP